MEQESHNGHRNALVIRLHEYYTPKSMKFQAVLDKITIFVDYADFYVNTIMSTAETVLLYTFIIFDYFARCCV